MNSLFLVALIKLFCFRIQSLHEQIKIRVNVIQKENFDAFKGVKEPLSHNGMFEHILRLDDVVILTNYFDGLAWKLYIRQCNAAYLCNYRWYFNESLL